MKAKIVIIAIFMAMVFASEKNDFEYEVKYEIDELGNAHVKWVTTIHFNEKIVDEVIPLIEKVKNPKNFIAYDKNTKKNISYRKESVGEFFEYHLDIREFVKNLNLGDTYSFVYEYDVFNIVSERNGKYSFYFGRSGWEGGGEEIYKVEVLLPQNYEYLESELASPVKLYERQKKTVVVYGGFYVGEGSFEFLLKYSVPKKIYLEEAYKLYNSKDYENAKIYFEKAKEKYVLLGNLEKVREIQDMIVICKSYIKADSFFNKAIKEFEKKNYEKASDLFFKAKIIYSKLYDEEMKNKSEEWREKSENIIEANNLFENAKYFFENKESEKARNFFVMAREKYQKLGDKEKVEECNKFLEKMEAGIGIFLSVVLIAIFLKFYKT